VRERRIAYDEYHDDEEYEYGEYEDHPSERSLSELRMTRWLALLVAGLVACGAWALLPVLDDLGPIFPFIRSHFPWALLPLTCLVFGTAAWGYVEFARFFEADSDAAIVIGSLTGLVVAVVVTLEWDGQVRFFSSVASNAPGGAIGAAAIAVLFLAVAAVARRADYEYWDWEDVSFFAIPVLLVILIGPMIYVIGYAGWTQIPWNDATAWLTSVVSDYWAFVGVIALIAIQAPGWRRYWRYRAQGAPRHAETSSKTTLLSFVTGGVTLALLVGAILYQIPEMLVSETGLSPAEYADSITQERRTLLAVMGALGAGVTLVYTHLRHQLDRDANATGRYTEAVQQLGNESMSIRLGGIYALARVARDSPGDRQTVAEVFAAFVRDGTRTATSGVALDVMAALTELGRTLDHHAEYEPGESVNLRSSNFTAGNLDSFRFPDGVDLSDSILAQASLRATAMRRATFYDADLSEADFRGALLRECVMINAKAPDAVFSDAQMSWTRASNALFVGADFRKAILTGSDLQGADLSEADFSGADLTGVDLRDANMTGASLRGARVERALLHGAIVSDKALAVTEGLEKSISTDIRVDRAAQKAYASWRAEEGGRRVFHGKDEYYRGYDPDDSSDEESDVRHAHSGPHLHLK
jgi:uncharacterized protein YjbI with pentapeptide repeats